MEVLIATEKPFAKVAVDGIKDILTAAGFDVKLLEKYTSHSELISAVATADALIVRSDKISADVFNAAKNLKIVVRAGAGYDNIDLEAATKSGVVVENTPGQNANAVAELVFGLAIMAARNKLDGTSGCELKDKTLGLQAFGQVGRNVARIAKGFGMAVNALDPYCTPETFNEAGVTAVTDVKELYKNNQYVSIHIPANEQTKKSIGYELITSMPKNGILINTARKEVINEDELAKALRDRGDIKYVADVKPDNASELEKEFGAQVFFTPKKMGAQTSEANINAGLAAARQIVSYFTTGDKRFQVNK